MQPEMRPFYAIGGLVAVALVAFVVLVVYQVRRLPTSQPEVWRVSATEPHMAASPWSARCAKSAATTSAILTSSEPTGGAIIIVGCDGRTLVFIKDRVWSDAPHDAKVSLALSAYCQIAKLQTNRKVHIQGLRAGDLTTALIDVHCSD